MVFKLSHSRSHTHAQYIFISNYTVRFGIVLKKKIDKIGSGKFLEKQIEMYFVRVVNNSISLFDL